MTFVPKGPACPKTCKYPDGDSNCPTKYVDGCQCPPGLVQDITENGDIFCVRPDECKVCKLEGKIFLSCVTANCLFLPKYVCCFVLLPVHLSIDKGFS